MPTRLLGASWVAAMVLAILATAAVAAQGGPGIGLPAPAAPPLARAAGPHPLPPAAATAATVTTAAVPRPRPKAKRLVTRTSATTTTTTTSATPALAAPPQVPDGKGMWIWQPDLAEHGDVAALVARAQAVGLTHLFVRTGSTWDGIQNLPYLDQLLPRAHAAGLKVYGWDFPKLASINDDVFRARVAVAHVTPSGDRLDGFAADIETETEGTQFSPAAASAYGAALRAGVGAWTLLVAVVPDPTPQMLEEYSYGAVVPAFDAVAPMVYWLNRDVGLDTANALHYLARFGKPLIPIGQAFDGGPEGGPPGVPPPAQLLRFMEVAKQYGAVAVSFWSWQHANAPAWDAIRTAPLFLAPLKPAASAK